MVVLLTWFQWIAQFTAGPVWFRGSPRQGQERETADSVAALRNDSQKGKGEGKGKDKGRGWGRGKVKGKNGRQQIPSLRWGMTARKARARGWARARATTTTTLGGEKKVVDRARQFGLGWRVLDSKLFFL
jgi:hypothetical protein